MLVGTTVLTSESSTHEWTDVAREGCSVGTVLQKGIRNERPPKGRQGGCERGGPKVHDELDAVVQSRRADAKAVATVVLGERRFEGGEHLRRGGQQLGCVRRHVLAPALLAYSLQPRSAEIRRDWPSRPLAAPISRSTRPRSRKPRYTLAWQEYLCLQAGREPR